MERILAAKRADAGVDFSAWERDVRCCEKWIDEHVNRLYLPATGLRQAGGLSRSRGMMALVRACLPRSTWHRQVSRPTMRDTPASPVPFPAKPIGKSVIQQVGNLRYDPAAWR